MNDRQRASEDLVVVGILAGAAVAAALSGAEPTGSLVPDVIWCALAAIAVAWGASWAGRLPLAWLGAVAAVVGVGNGWLSGTFGLLALGTGVLAASERRPSRELAALSGALAIQALLRGPSYGFVGLPTLVALAGVLPALISGWQRSPAPQRRIANRTGLVVGAVVLVALVGAGVAALLARPKLVDAGNQAETALTLLRDGDIDEAVDPLAQASDEFSTAAGLLNGPLGFAGRVVPVVGQHVEALGRVADAGEDLTQTAGEAATSADYEQLKADNGNVDLDQVRAMAAPVRASADAVLEAQQVVADVRSPWLVEPVDSELDRLARELADTAPAAVDAADALELAPALLGGDGERRYLLQFATPGESRPAGGFVGTYGVLVADQGSLSLGITGSTAELGPESADAVDDAVPYPFDPPPGWEELYGRFYVQYFPGNVSASPDWPTDSEVARQIYAQVPEVGETDGVLYADPTALAAMLQLTGPVEVPGLDFPLDAGNAEEYLLEGQYIQFDTELDQRRDLLSEVSRSVFEALTSRPLPALGELRTALGPAVSGGHLKFASFDEEAEALFVRTGLAGAWQTTPGADWLSLRSTNLLPNKIDWFLRREMTVDSTIDPDTGTIETTVTVTLRNLAPPSGLPPYLIGNYGDFPTGTNNDGLALYSPHGLDQATVDGRSVGVEAHPVFGGNVFTVPVVIPPGGEATVVYQLSGTVADPLTYRLDLLHQPLAHNDDVTVRLRSSTGRTTVTLFEGPLAEDAELIAIGR
ncbi:MAG TPA: DUF4012 domain-containing protein [Acidimicrobiales bacterium]